MKLRVLSDYGAEERVVSEEATVALVRSTMRDLDWQGFHQVVLEKVGGDWLEVGGSLNPDDGLSVMFEEGGVQHVIAEPPATVDEMTDILERYLQGDERWRRDVAWS
ncbi:MAG: hypothetical protein AAF533_28135 [Acidobacteriota bacterium]